MSRKRKKTGIQNIVFLLSSIITFVAGMVLVGWADDYSIVWRYSMFMNAPNLVVAVSFVLAACVVAPIIDWFKKQNKPRAGSSSNRGIWLPILLIGFPVMMCFTQIGIIINGAFDKSDAKTFSAMVLGKREVHTMRSNSRYITVDDWYNPATSVQIRVSDSNYRAIQIGDSIDVVTKDGFLGYEWMVGPDFMKAKVNSNP